MASYIMSILRSQLLIILSWGFYSPVALDNGLQFQVNGFLFKGRVRVIYDEGSDTFIVRTIKADGSINAQVDDVYLDCLVTVIDGLVEKCEGYEERVKDAYGL